MAGERFTADFETTTDPNDCRVWAWAMCNIEKPEQSTMGKNIDGFIQYCEEELHNPVVYFHNLKFDGEFIIVWLFKNGFTHVKDKKLLTDKSFTTLISGEGQFYAMTIMLQKKKKKVSKIEILDSMKIIPFSVDKIAKAFKLKTQKLEIDYNKYRPVGYMPDRHEQDYILNDVKITAQALRVLFEQGLTKMTQGSNALHDYKRIVGWKFFKRHFPPPVDYDNQIRPSYKGGFTYLNPKFKLKDIGPGIVLDVNSLYPWAMYTQPMPYGKGLPFDGEYEHSNLYPLYIQNIRCHFKLKKDHIPTIQLKNNFFFSATEYVTSSKGEDIFLSLTSVDLKLFLDHYNVYNLEFLGGWKFKAKETMFKEYIDKWSAEKIKAKQENNAGIYTLSKLMLNALYGKFALNPVIRSKYPVLVDDAITYITGDKETREPLYLPVGTFITAYAREKTIRAAQTVFDRFIYADTDSLHLEGLELPDNLIIDPIQLGAWKHELTFDYARYLHAKTYVEYGCEPGENMKELKITCAGMPKSCHQFVTYDNFRAGNRFPGKLLPKHVAGGIVLSEIEFTLNA